MRKSILLALIMSALLVGCEKKASLSGSDAPGFQLLDTGGRPVALSSFRGKVVVLEFWATWCPSCKDAIPELIDFSQKNKELSVLSVSIDEDASSLKSFVSAYRIPYTVMVDDRNVRDKYLVSSIPSFFLIDKKGRIVKKYLGYAPGMMDNISMEIAKLI